MLWQLAIHPNVTLLRSLSIWHLHHLVNPRCQGQQSHDTSRKPEVMQHKYRSVKTHLQCHIEPLLVAAALLLPLLPLLIHQQRQTV